MMSHTCARRVGGEGERAHTQEITLLRNVSKTILGGDAALPPMNLKANDGSVAESPSRMPATPLLPLLVCPQLCILFFLGTGWDALPPLPLSQMANQGKEQRSMGFL